MTKAFLKNAFRDTVPVLTGYLVLGMGFGMIMNASGFDFCLTVSMSIFIYAGSMQYAAVGLLTGGASMVTIALTTLAVNARHLFYGISMIERYRGAGWKKPYLILTLTDETYSLVCRGQGDQQRAFLVSLFDHFYWVTGSALGFWIGTALPINTQGIEFSLTALFMTVFCEQWLSTKDHLPAILGVLISIVCLLIFGPSQFLIPAMLGISVALLLCMRKGDNIEQC